MGDLELVRLDPAITKTLENDAEYLEAAGQGDWPRVAGVVQRVLGRTLEADPVSVDQLEWGGYYAVDAATREVVGSCAFKAPPTAEGMIEIAYFTYPEFERRGYATWMARKLIELASGSPAVRQVIAHTLPEANPSTRVLQRAGMTFVGEVIDPEDGRVWRWQTLPRPPASVP